MNSDRVTDSHVKLNILVDLQECLNNSHHKVRCLCELVEESTLATSEVSLSEDSSLQQNTSIAFGYYCCEIETDAPQFKYYYSKSKVTQKIGTLQSQRLF